MYRGEKMSFCEMFLQPEAAFETINILGNMGRVQFTDMNEDVPPYMKNYIAEVCRCAELERKLRYIESEIQKDNIDIPHPTEDPKPLHPGEMGLFEHIVDKWETDILEIASNEADLKQDLLEMKEMRYILANMDSMLGDSNLGMGELLSKYKLGAGDIPLSGRLYMMTGVVKRARSFAFQLMLWRVSRGNIYYRQASYDEVLQDPYTGGDIRKVAFLTICQGETLAARMGKVFTGFRVNVYPCPETAEERFGILSKVENRILDLEEVVEKAKYYRCRSMRLVSRQWKTGMIQVRKAKAIYHTMNQFNLDITKNCLIGLCWVPSQDLQSIQNTLRHISVPADSYSIAVLSHISGLGLLEILTLLVPCTYDENEDYFTGSLVINEEDVESSVPSFIATVEGPSEPPTSQRTNKFSYGFQMLINAYGDSKYREINPGLYTIITFPFLFSIMFGDMGHSLIMIAFAVWMLIYEKEFMKQPGSEIWNIFFGGRYVILLLGAFSIMTGFIYNDVFSKAFNLSQSMWVNTITSPTDLDDVIRNNPSIDFSSHNRKNKPYVFGVDPIWVITQNKIMIDNSMKMKMSLIIGVIHMLFGIFLSLLNHIYYKKYYLVFLQFLPEVIFLTSIFVWLVFLMFYKWTHYYDGHKYIDKGSSCAPQILILFINMVLFGQTESKALDADCKANMFANQENYQFILMTFAIIMIPILLFGPPVYVNWSDKRNRKKIRAQMTQFRKYRYTQDANEIQDRLQAELEKYNSSFSEMMIHQAVETIEFVLSTVSHTASYLRLWALSLAHSQLSEMLWGMILAKLSLQEFSYPAGAIKVFLIFPVWAAFTVSILVVMEGLSAFLHTLRLHWVEFMSKFFIGGGYLFKPFCFKTILAADVRTDAACSSKRPRGRALMQRQKNTINIPVLKMLRSVPMAYCEIYMQPATAFETIAQMAELKGVQFVDRNSGDAAHVRTYSEEICRCAALESKLEYFEAQIRKEGSKVKMLDPEDDPKPIHPSEMAMFEKMIEKWERDITEISDNIVELKLDLMELKEIDGVMKYIGPLLDTSREELQKLRSKFVEDAGDTCCQEQLYILSGVLEREKAMICQQMLWRISHGNIYYRQTTRDIVLQEPCKGEIRKVAFIAACQSKELLTRLEKICAAFKAKIYPCPTNPEERAELHKKLNDRVNELDNVLGKSRFYRIMVLRSVAKQWRGWMIQVRKTRAIYHQMNLMRLNNSKNCLIANCWVRERDIPRIQLEMNKCMQALGVRAPSVIIKVPNPEKVVLPTIQHTNRFTHAPQVLIDTYGIARYREINPALFTIIGLPFLFGVMFSDMGHAAIVIGIALWLIIQEKSYAKIRGNMFWDAFFGARYTILLMGIWGAIAGLCYNQLFAKSINLSNSMYKNVLTEDQLKTTDTTFMGANSRLKKPYIWGMDPIWQVSNNKLTIKNSLMLKMSIIIGTIHMLFGLLLNACNLRYFKNYHAIYLQFLPKFLIILVTFGWISSLFYYKWFYFYDEAEITSERSGVCAPPLLPIILDRYLPKFIYPRVIVTTRILQGADMACSVTKLYIRQDYYELLLNIILILSIIVLLFGTPLYIVLYNANTRKNIKKEIRDFRMNHMKGCKLSCSNPCGTYCEEACGKRVEEWKKMIDQHSTPFAPLLTTQFINTLEFLLGVIVHMASYLRIWALSMGHYILSSALWIVFIRNIGLGLLVSDKDYSALHTVSLTFGFIFFAIFTFIVIVVLEGVCCFLHALRLHWIEFMSKFFIDEGFPFQPFSYDNMYSDLDKLQETCNIKKYDSPELKDCLSGQPL